MIYKCLAFLCFCLLLVFLVSQSHVRYVEQGKIPHDFMFMQRAFPTGKIRTDAAELGKQWKRQKSRTSQNMSWELVGPLNVGGRITDIEIPIEEEHTYYVGAASGGIFKTTDAGASWVPIFDDAGSLSIGDIEISKNNTDIVWVGTGEVNAGGGSLAYDGDGAYTSRDGGQSWTATGLDKVGSISKIVIDPNDDETVFAGAMGPLFKNDPNRGVYRTTDSGGNWTQVLFLSDSTGVIDMAIHPSNGDIVYAATWERVRRPQYRHYGGITSGIYRSTDGGDNWTELTAGLPNSANDKGRISIDISESNPDVLYARYANAAGSILGVFKTNDGGDTWNEVNSSQLFNVGFHWWFRGIFIDPTDENTIYNVDFVVQKSTDGGNSWFTAFSGVHVDQHALAFNSVNNNEVLLGNDGGLYISNDDGSSYVKDLSLPITQFYRFYVDPQNSDKVYGGSQDNSTIRTTTGGLSDWQTIFGGDGFQPLVSATNTNIIYALSQNGNLVKSTNNAGSFFGAANGITGSDRNNWDTPISFDPQNSDVLYYGTQRLWKTTNGAGNWTAISGDLSNGSGFGNLTFGTITSIDVSPLDGDMIIVGTDDSQIWITKDGGNSWNNVSSTLPDLWTTKVLADRDDPNSFYVTFSGYRYGANLGHIFKTNDNGLSWTDIGSDLPDIPVNDIVKDQHANLFAGSDIGVFVSYNDGLNWFSFGDNIPSAVVTDLHLHESEQILFAATYGRSAYKIDISSLVAQQFPHLLVDDDCLELIYNNSEDYFMLQGSLDKYSIEILDVNENVLETLNNQQTDLIIEDNLLMSGSKFVRVRHNVHADLFFQYPLL